MSSGIARMTLAQASYRFLLIVTIGTMAGSVAGAAETLGIEEIKARFKQQREQIQSLYIEVKREEKPCVDLKVLLTLHGFLNKSLVTNDEVHFALKGEKRYHRQVRPPDTKYLRPVGTPPKLHPKAGPLERESHRQHMKSLEEMKQRQARSERMGLKVGVAEGPVPDVTKAYNGRTQWRKEVRRNGDVYFNVNHPQDSWHWFQPPQYLMAVGLAIPDPLEKEEVALEGYRLGLLPDLFERWTYSVSDEIEKIDGAKCLVLTGKPQLTITMGPVTETVGYDDRLWLDLDHGLAIRQRDVLLRGHFNRTVNSHFDEVLPGLWLPKQIETQTFAPPGAPKELEGRPVMIATLTLAKCVVNQVPDDLFDMVTKPGDHVMDLRGPKWHRP